MPSSPSSEWVAIVDFGSQYTQLIARRTRELGVYSEVHPCTADAEGILARSPVGLILSGGPRSVLEPDAPRIAPAYLREGHPPILGICYGLQALCHQMGGRVEKSSRREYGHAEVRTTARTSLFRDFPSDEPFPVWMSHGDRVAALPQGFGTVAGSKDSPCAAVADEHRRIWGVQFHPEVAHTPGGAKILRRFLFDACGAKGTWRLSDFAERVVRETRERTGDASVVLGLSGGVDSTVAAALLSRALGHRLHAIFVDNGLLREGEAEEVADIVRRHTDVTLHVASASARFLAALKGVTDPEEKRRRIGGVFIDVFRDESRHISGARFLAQGTLYPDVIESVSAFGGPTATIKTHHNVGGLPKELGFELVEPFRMLFKDEVRAIGAQLGLPDEVVWRQPFPGPGLAVRILGEVTPHRLRILREADAIVRKEIAPEAKSLSL
ncbi:MAG: glutamine-hydrolyzing GMP synthase, partial [Planctomycetes bacterium]|nr:glutamine-hydrolyzing GMP synthase [Planctomycetota bacterium]